jgi:hypothetical protein
MSKKISECTGEQTIIGTTSEDYVSSVPLKCTITVSEGTVQVVFNYPSPIPKQTAKVGKDSTASLISAVGTYGIIGIEITGINPVHSKFTLIHSPIS